MPLRSADGSGHIVERPAAVFLMTSRPLGAGIVQQAPPDILPDGALAVESDGVDFLDFDAPAAAPAAHPQKVLGNFAKRQRGDAGSRRFGTRFLQKRMP